MKEFGSDFHRCDANYIGGNEFKKKCLYANGRQSLHAIIECEKYQRIWIPAYFCYDVIEYLMGLGIQVMLYDDNPLCENDDILVRNLPYQNGDVLLRMNYFGFREFRNNKDIPVPVIEDHSHDIIGDWALRSNADWCIASLRKSLPIAIGGALWSPKHVFPSQVSLNDECVDVANIRYEAMSEKGQYLNSNIDNKKIFRDKFIQTEERLVKLPLSTIDKKSLDILNNFDIRQWTDVRRDNWNRIYSKFFNRWNILKFNNVDDWNPFSVVILCDTNEERDDFRKYLVNHCIYPAILWNIPESVSFEKAKDFSRRMLSIHCDGRYSMFDIEQMCDIILKYD